MRRSTALLVTAAALAAGGGALRAARRRRTTTMDPRLERFRDLSGAPFGPPDIERPSAGLTANARVLPPDWEPPSLTALAAWDPQPPRTAAGRALAYVWAAPLSVAGVVLGLAGGGRPRIAEGILLFERTRGPLGGFLRLRGFSATTLGHVVVCRGEPDAVLMAHERCHVRQAERLGPLFGLLYVALTAIYGYARHPMERAARAAARRTAGAP